MEMEVEKQSDGKEKVQLGPFPICIILGFQFIMHQLRTFLLDRIHVLQKQGNAFYDFILFNLLQMYL